VTAAVIAVVGLALAAISMATVAILAERRAGSARVKAAEEHAARLLVEYQRDEALGDVERLQRRGDALEEFARDQISRLGGMLDADGVDLLLAELSIAAEPRGRPIAAPAGGGVPSPGPVTDPSERGSDDPEDGSVPTGGPA